MPVHIKDVPSVISAKAEIQFCAIWIAACAAMTESRLQVVKRVGATSMRSSLAGMHIDTGSMQPDAGFLCRSVLSALLASTRSPESFFLRELFAIYRTMNERLNL